MKKMNTLQLAFLATLMVGCNAVMPAFNALALAFGQNLIAATSVNYAPYYAQEMEALLVALARTTTGLELQATLAQSGYQPPQPSYAANQPQNNPYGQQSTQGNSQSNPYGQQNDPYAQQSDPSAQSNNPYAQQSNDPYAQQSNDPYAQSSDPYAQQTPPPSQSGDPYAEQADPYAQSSDPYAQQNNPYATRGIQPIELEANILAQRAGSTRLFAIEDGEVLRDGGNDPASGDLLKVQFKVNCACHVYVIGVDATGYVAQIYPDAEEGHSNPVAAGRDYLVPEGPEDWWGMDSFKGVEQVFFIASYTRREDIEQVLSRMANQPRNVSLQSYQPVTEAAYAPSTRGLVKVRKDPVSVKTASGTQSFTPTLFASEETTGEVVVTRWFRHE